MQKRIADLRGEIKVAQANNRECQLFAKKEAQHSLAMYEEAQRSELDRFHMGRVRAMERLLAMYKEAQRSELDRIEFEAQHSLEKMQAELKKMQAIQ